MKCLLSLFFCHHFRQYMLNGSRCPTSIVCLLGIYLEHLQMNKKQKAKAITEVRLHKGVMVECNNQWTVDDIYIFINIRLYFSTMLLCIIHVKVFVIYGFGGRGDFCGCLAQKKIIITSFIFFVQQGGGMLRSSLFSILTCTHTHKLPVARFSTIIEDDYL